MRDKGNPAPTGPRILAARECTGLTQREFATRAELDWHAYWRYEAGRTVPGIGPLAQIARAAGVRMEWLATGDGPMREDSAA